MHLCAIPVHLLLMCAFCIRCSPIDNHSDLKDVASAVSVDSCLEDGWAPIARLIQQADNNMTVKANAFLASLSRIDDSRMLSKYKTAESSSTKYIVECYSVAEREKMKGLPAGCVENPLCHLFHELTTKAFLRPEMSKGKLIVTCYLVSFGILESNATSSLMLMMRILFSRLQSLCHWKVNCN